MDPKRFWHRWYAWYPVKTEDGERVWMRFVERRLYTSFNCEQWYIYRA